MNVGSIWVSMWKTVDGVLKIELWTNHSLLLSQLKKSYEFMNKNYNDYVLIDVMKGTSGKVYTSVSNIM